MGMGMGMRGRARKEKAGQLANDTPPDDRLEVINFVHAAAEWGSTVLVPEAEVGRLMEVAGRRRVADADVDADVDADAERMSRRE